MKQNTTTRVTTSTYAETTSLPKRDQSSWSDAEIAARAHEPNPSASTTTLEAENGLEWVLGGDIGWTQNRETLSIYNPLTETEELLRKIHWEDSRWEASADSRRIYLSESGYIVVTARFLTGAGKTTRESLCYAGPYKTARSNSNWKQVFPATDDG